MSESEQTPRKVRIGLLPVLVLIAVIVGGGIWFALSQNSTPDAAAPAPVATSAAPVATPSATPSPSATPTQTARPLPTPEEALTAELGRGYELKSDGAPADLCSATFFIAPYNIDAGKPSGRAYLVETTEGSIQILPVTNDANGYSGSIIADC